MMKSLVRIVAVVALVLVGWLGREAVGFKAEARKERTREAPVVTALVVTNGVFNPPSEYVGHVEPAQVTDILPQVDGYVQRVCFTEGDKVEKGDLLFEIDQEQYLAAKNLRYSEVASAEAKVTVAQSEVDRAERYYRRLSAADERGVSATERDTAETSLASAKAALNAANAAVEQAKASAAIADFNLRHTKVYSPISGRIGKALHHVGDYVSPSKSALARVVQTDPIRVVFPVSDRDYDAWQAAAERGGRALKDSRRLRLTLPDGSIYGHEGVIDFGDNEMSRETATLTMHVCFANPAGRLVANAFVRVLSDERNPPSALVVPTAALVRTDEGLQAWVVADDGKVHPVMVETGGEWNGLSRIEKGLSEGVRIVGSGAFKLKESPRWLYRRGREAEALASLAANNGEEKAAEILAEMKASDAAEAAQKAANAAATDTLFQKKYVIPFLLAVTILACNQTTGINSVLNYTVTIFRETGLQGAFANFSDLAIKVMNMLMTIVACTLVDKKGRKFLLKLGTSGIIVGLSGVGLTFLAISQKWMAASMTTGVIATVFFFMFIAFYAVGPGVCVWLALTELMPTRIRANGMAIAMIINQGVSALIATVFPTWVASWGFPGVFFCLAGFTVVYFITAAFFLPETKGRTLEEIEQYFTTGKMPEKK